MTLAVQTNRVVYNGDGATTTFAIPFAFNGDQSNVLVVAADANGTETTKVYVTDYTISGSTVTMVAAPASNTFLLIINNFPITQALSLSNQATFLPASMMAQMDLIVGYIQQLQEEIDRCFKLNKTSTSKNIEIPRALVANAALVVNAAGTALAYGPTASDITNAASYAASASSSATSASSSASSAGASAAAALSSAAAAAASAASAAASVGTPVSGETPSGTINNSNTAFNLAHTPNASFPFQLYLDGFRETAFSRVGTAITMTTAPDTGQTLVADYVY